MSFCVFCQSDNTGTGCWLVGKTSRSLLALASFNKRQVYDKRLRLFFFKKRETFRISPIWELHICTDVKAAMKIWTCHCLLRCKPDARPRPLRCISLPKLNQRHSCKKFGIASQTWKLMISQWHSVSHVLLFKYSRIVSESNMMYLCENILPGIMGLIMHIENNW